MKRNNNNKPSNKLPQQPKGTKKPKEETKQPDNRLSESIKQAKEKLSQNKSPQPPGQDQSGFDMFEGELFSDSNEHKDSYRSMGQHISQTSSKMIEKEDEEEEVKASHFAPPRSPGIKVADFQKYEENDELYFKEQLEQAPIFSVPNQKAIPSITRSNFNQKAQDPLQQMLTSSFPKFNFDQTESYKQFIDLQDPEKQHMLFETNEDQFISLDRINQEMFNLNKSTKRQSQNSFQKGSIQRPGSAQVKDSDAQSSSQGHGQINDSQLTEEGGQFNETALLDSTNAISLFAMDVDELKSQRRLIEQQERKEEKERQRRRKQKEREIKVTQNKTEVKIDKRTQEFIKILELKEQNNQSEYGMKEKMLRKNFAGTVERLIAKIKQQRDLLLQAYGPLVLNSKKNEPPIFNIHNKDRKDEFIEMLHTQEKVPQPIKVKVVTARCLKDKVGSGHFIMMCSVYDRIGGKRINYNLEECEDQLRTLSHNFRTYDKNKHAFINQEHREMKVQVDGVQQMVAAPKTGANWFKPIETEKITEDIEKNLAEVEDTEEIDPSLDIKLEFDRKQTKFTRFDGRYFDNDLVFDDHINLLIPPVVEPSNIILFELYLLQSDTVPKDYVVGWGVFPLVDSEFQLNQGCFKVPLLFGSVNVGFDKFGRMEDHYKNDVDNWLCNVYFEIDRIRLSEIKINKDTKELYHRVHKPKGLRPMTTGVSEGQQENQERVGDQMYRKPSLDHSYNHNKDETELSEVESNSEGEEEEEKKKSQVSDSLIEDEQSQRDDEAMKQEISQYSHEILINRSKDTEDIESDKYHFSVGQKLDLRTRELTFKKIRYIMDEVLEDFSLKKLKTIELHLGLIYIFFLFFLRMWTHYIGQYFILAIMKVPVTLFEPHWHKIRIEYASWNFVQEILTVCFGIFSNTILFTVFITFAFLSKKLLNCIPRMFYKVICWYGILTMLDPFIVLLLDCVDSAWTFGDYFRFYNYYFKKQASGLVGIYLTIFVIFAFTVLNGFLFYNYMIFIHMNGRILDLYKRLSGSMKSFFVPHDNEVSLKYVQWVLERAKHKNYILKSSRQTVHDRKGKERQIQFIHIFKYDQSNRIHRSRLFVKDQDGSICEVPQAKILLREDEIQSLAGDLQTGIAQIFGNAVEDVAASINQRQSIRLAQITKSLGNIPIQQDKSSNYDPFASDSKEEMVFPDGHVAHQKHSQASQHSRVSIHQGPQQKPQEIEINDQAELIKQEMIFKE